MGAGNGPLSLPVHFHTELAAHTWVTIPFGVEGLQLTHHIRVALTPRASRVQAESGSLAGLQHPLLTEKETEFAGCARDLPRFLLSASCLDVPQQPDLSFRSLPQCLSGCPLTACPGESLLHCPASRPTMKAGPLKQEEPSSCVTPSLHGYSL